MQFHPIMRFSFINCKVQDPKMPLLGGNWDPDTNISMWYTEIWGSEKVVPDVKSQLMWEENRSKVCPQLFCSEKPEESPLKSFWVMYVEFNGHVLPQRFSWQDEAHNTHTEQIFYWLPLCSQQVTRGHRKREQEGMDPALGVYIAVEYNWNDSSPWAGLQRSLLENRELRALNIKSNACRPLDDEVWPWDRRRRTLGYKFERPGLLVLVCL